MNATAIPRATQVRRRRRRRLWAAAVIVLLAGVGYLAWSPRGAADIGARAPAFRLEDSDGRMVDVGQVLGRKPIVLVFYMTYD